MNNMTDSQHLADIMQNLQLISHHHGPGGRQPEQNITIARSIVQFFDQSFLLQRAGSFPEQVFVISALQDIAFHDPDSGGIRDITQWCVRQWLSQ